jgi:hypothetical protein
MAVAVLVTLACTATVLAGTPNPQDNVQAIDPAFLEALAEMAEQDPYIGDPPQEPEIGDPPQEEYPVPPDEEVTVVDSGHAESPCINGFKEITDWTLYSDGTMASSIVTVPCDVDDNSFDNPDDGGEIPGDDNPGDDNPGDDNPGDDNPGDDNPGDDNPGDDNPGGEEPKNPVPQTPANNPVTASSLPYTGGRIGLLAIAAGLLGLMAFASVMVSRRLRQRA